ncbi:MAG: ABC transporter ATP-binding protein [Acetivibrionales bacterium]|jgi:ATP-binding cassette subfamily B multidrug efflux pump|nr:ABC transporter ATP-binding protein [Bacillota bacterium]NLP07800.1 ABC transporter ATP-binding protein [Clostridiaceae bacterium]HOA54688.1 ABC transporter ATP-binding protein [Clostridiales bacterium]HPZ04427.1 ABC transporter ATP-binding protein [Clostridiales bacterium]
MKMIFSYLRPYVPRMILGLSIKFTGTIMDLLIPWVLSYTIDDIVPLGDVKLIFVWGGVMFLCAVTAFVTNVTANRMASKVARDATEVIRHDLFEKISYMSCRQVDEFTIPSLESRLTNDTYHIHRMIGMMQRLGVRAPILLLGGIIVTLALEPVLSLTLILMLPFITLLVYLISKKGIPLFTESQRSVDKLVRTVRENIAGIRVIKALSKTAYEKERFGKVNSEVVKNESRAGITMALTNPAMNLLLNLGLTLVIITGAYRINAGLTKSGEIIAFLTYFTIILNAMLSITRMFVMYSKGSASADRIREVLEAPDDLVAESVSHTNDEYHITFENVTFSYHKSKSSAVCFDNGRDEKKNTLEDISFALRKGETLGIIGATGSGKSTIARLLLRLYDPDEGVIRISGDDLRSIPQDELHTKFGVVFQNDILFADTIASNISFGREISQEQIEKAAACAQAREFIDQLPLRYEHMLATKSSNLSGGQKQRLLIARALAADPEILILDDSSSALDYKTDSLLRKALAEDFGNTTTIIIAQRISSIMHADRILILEDGKMLGYGTHTQLLETCEVYREIYELQMGGDSIA